ncbi:MAG: (2Fe-2S) ferredoxin domain-containing protein [Lachnospirales bacterium]
MDLFICVGSSCHLKGSKNIINKLSKLINDENMQNDVIIKGSFCLGKCSEHGVSVKLNDEIYSLEEKDIDYFFKNKILPFKK